MARKAEEAAKQEQDAEEEKGKEGPLHGLVSDNKPEIVQSLIPQYPGR